MAGQPAVKVSRIHSKVSLIVISEPRQFNPDFYVHTRETSKFLPHENLSWKTLFVCNTCNMVWMKSNNKHKCIVIICKQLQVDGLNRKYNLELIHMQITNDCILVVALKH